MANYTANGTYTLPNNGDTTATVNPGLTDVNFVLTNQDPASYTISSNVGSDVGIKASSASATTILNLDVQGGTITLDSSLGNDALQVNAAIDGGGIAAIPGDLINTLSGGNVTFGSGGGINQLGTAGEDLNLSSPRINSGFTSSADVIDDRSLAFGNFVNYTVGGQNVSGIQTIVFDSGSNSTLSISVFGANLTPGSYTSTSNGPLLLTKDASGGTDITPNVVCYVQGTRIATPQGESAVEDLQVGDLVDTRSGPDGELTARPVKWLGYRRINVRTHPRPETVAPIRICKGAIADNVPHRDLLVSPDHALLIDSKLINARQLVNGKTIRQERNWLAVDYYHVELENHAILLAEGLPAESYLTTGNRGFFANATEPLILHPNLTDEADNVTREASSCAPFVWDEENVLPVWQRLADRAAALGRPVKDVDTTTDPGLSVTLKGQRIRPLDSKNGRYMFILPANTAEVRLVSRAGAPTDVRPWLDDRRRLGMYVEQIMVRSVSTMQEIPLDHPGLVKGWWEVERNGMALRRWTNGDAMLPLPVTNDPVVLEILAGSSGLTYLMDAEELHRAS